MINECTELTARQFYRTVSETLLRRILNFLHACYRTSVDSKQSLRENFPVLSIIVFLGFPVRKYEK